MTLFLPKIQAKEKMMHNDPLSHLEPAPQLKVCLSFATLLCHSLSSASSLAMFEQPLLQKHAMKTSSVQHEQGIHSLTHANSGHVALLDMQGAGNIKQN